MAKLPHFPSQSEGLAAGWVAGMSLDGRIYYIDHNTHSTTWEKPRLLERRPTSEETGHGAQQAEQVHGMEESGVRGC